MDGNTDDKKVQETFIGTLMETMKGGNFPVYEDSEDAAINDDGTVLQDLERHVAAAGPTGTERPPELGPVTSPVARAAVAGPAVPHQNGYIPNNTNNNNNNNNTNNNKNNTNNSNNNNQEQQMRYDVRNMYAQIGSYPNDSVL